jgi:probable phosphoglycerate mutase
MIYLLRHGAVERGEEKRFVGQIDLPLSPKGLEQARWWQRKLAATVFEGIYCSDLVRARRTAYIIGEGKESRVEVMTGLREIHLGEWDGLSMTDVRNRFPDEWRKRGESLISYHPPAGESFSDLYGRVIPVFERILEQLEGNALIVGHAGVNRVILCYVLGIPLENLFRLGQDYGCLSMIDHQRNPIRVVKMNFCPEIDDNISRLKTT